MPGTVLAGRYRLDSLIGGGSFGTVFRARHLELDRDVAVKVLATSAGTDPEALARFRREGASACRVQHPNAVAVLDFGVNPGGVAYLVMELLEGHSLEKELEDAAPLRPRRCAEIVMPVCAALAAAHAAGVVHRDIKPSNVFLHRTPQRRGAQDPRLRHRQDRRARRRRAEPHRRRLAARARRPTWRPSASAAGPTARKSDVYSVGAMLYEMLSGRLPFIPSSADPLALVAMQAEEDPPPLRARCPEVPPALEALVRRRSAATPTCGRRPTARAAAGARRRRPFHSARRRSRGWSEAQRAGPRRQRQPAGVQRQGLDAGRRRRSTEAAVARRQADVELATRSPQLPEAPAFQPGLASARTGKLCRREDGAS